MRDYDLVTPQDPSRNGFDAMINSIIRMAEQHLQVLDRRRRETPTASALAVGMQCGGSDAPGVTANPALCPRKDLGTRRSHRHVFGEHRGPRWRAAHRTRGNADVAKALIAELGWYDRYSNGSVNAAPTQTPGNKRGGLSNIVEKAMGSIIKSGTAPISGVVPPGERALGKGLLYAATPASDFICGTLQLAAGMTLRLQPAAVTLRTCSSCGQSRHP